MTADRSLLIVNYRSAALTRDAISSARATCKGPLQVVVVDNTCSDAEMEVLRSAGADRLIAAERNLGYAGAINRGAAESEGRVLIVSNPDVIFFEGCMDTLAGTVESGAAAVTGPRFFWDSARQWLLPPADRATTGLKLDELLASRNSGWRRRRDRRRIRERLAFWSRQQPRPVDVLSGAVLCLERDTFDGVGGFDERFRLYFEEIDFLRRVSRANGRVVHVPAAECRHVYNQSAGVAPEAASQYGVSEREYYGKWGGSWVIALAEWLGPQGFLTGQSAPHGPADFPIRVDGDPRRFVVEASPLAGFDSAAGHFPLRWPVTVPRDVWEAYRSPELFVRVVEKATAEVVLHLSLAPPGRAEGP